MSNICAFWADTWHDSSLHGGQDWFLEILRRIADCDTFNAIISRDVLSSTACRREFDWAESLDKPVIPVAVEPPPKAFPDVFRNARSSTTPIGSLGIARR